MTFRIKPVFANVGMMVGLLQRAAVLCDVRSDGITMPVVSEHEITSVMVWLVAVFAAV